MAPGDGLSEDSKELPDLRTHLPWQAENATWQQLERFSKELGAVWGELGVAEQERLADSEVIAAAASAAARACLEAWRRKGANLEARCEELQAEACACMAALNGEEAEALAACSALPLCQRPSALQELLGDLSQLLLQARAELLGQLGRSAEAAEPQRGRELPREVARLREELRQRRASAELAAGRLHGIWEELGLQPQQAGDEELQRLLRAAGAGLALTDARHGALLGALAEWEGERGRRREELLALHGRMRALGQACLPAGDLEALEHFLAAHGRCRDAAACRRREQELQASAQRRLRALLGRRREALAALDAAGRGAGADDGPVEDLATAAGLSALAASVEKLELKARQWRGLDSLEAARRARALWEELGEEPERGGRDLVALGLLANEFDAEPEAEAQDATAVEVSLASWQARRAEVANAVVRLHGEIAEFQDQEPFLEQHGTLHRRDRAACKARLRELREDAWRADLERSSLERLQRFAEKGMQPPEAFAASARELRERQRAVFSVRS